MHEPLIRTCNTHWTPRNTCAGWGKVRQNPEHFVTVWDDVAFHYLFQSQMVYSPSWDGVTFPSILLSIPQPHRGILFLREVESLQHEPPEPATWLDVTVGRGECRMSGHSICTRLPGMDQTSKKFLSQADSRGGQKVRCGWKLVARSRRQGWLALLYFISATILTKCYWDTNVVSVQVQELILRCVSSVLAAIVHFRCEMNCCAELHVGNEKYLSSSEKVNSV